MYLPMCDLCGADLSSLFQRPTVRVEDGTRSIVRSLDFCESCFVEVAAYLGVETRKPTVNQEK